MAKRKVPAKEETIPEERELPLDQTEGFEIVIERYVSPRSVSGEDLGYGVRNKKTGVTEMRWGAYSEALQGLMLLQNNLDRHLATFLASQKRLN